MEDHLCTRTHFVLLIFSLANRVSQRERLLRRVLGVLHTYRDEGRPFDTHHSSTSSWSVLSYPISAITWFRYYQDMETYLQNIDDIRVLQTLYIRGTVFVPFHIIPNLNLRLAVYRLFYFNTPYSVWHFVRNIKFRLLFVGTTSLENRAAIVSLSLTNQHSDGMLCES